MDLGCLDLGCISVLDKQSNETFVETEKKNGDAEESVMTTAKVGKNRVLKESGQSTLNSVNKSTTQIKKPPHRKNSSPLNWFPRKKTDSYLKRKIRLLQEVGGMNSTLDETLGDSNPHYSRVEREKIAVREAARKAMEARKAAMVEASWCRILRAARIQSKESDALLLKAEKSVGEAFEAATAMGVIMYDRPDCPRKPCEIESSSVNRGGSTTHTITASFETAFEVDKEVAAAVKTAFIQLANCSSCLSKDEFKDLLRRISQNPDTNETNQDVSEFSSECESEDTGSELELESHEDDSSSQGLNCKIPAAAAELRQRKNKNRQLPENNNTTKLVDMMLDRLKCLQEDELASLATIVATCGLNAALTEVENRKQHNPESGVTFTRNLSSVGVGTMKHSTGMEYSMGGPVRRKEVVTKLPSLDKFLMKHMSRLEREVQEAKNTKMNEPKEGCGEKPEGSEDGVDNSKNNAISSEVVPDLESILVKHYSKLEKEIEKAKKESGKELGEERKRIGNKQDGLIHKRKQDVPDIPSLDKFLVKHVSKLEREVQEARRNTRKFDQMADSTKIVTSSCTDGKQEGKENIDSNKQVDGYLCTASSTESKEGSLMIKQLSQTETLETFSQKDGKETKETDNGLDSILVKPVHRLEREKMQALTSGMDYGTQRYQKKQGRTNVTDCESLDKVLVKHVSRLEREKMGLGSKEEVVKVKKTEQQSEKSEGGLDQILVKHQSRLEKEKLAAAQQSGEDQIKHLETRREARERELQEAWGGFSLGNSIRPHFSRLERDKAAWIKAEEEERRQARKELSDALSKKMCT